MTNKIQIKNGEGKPNIGILDKAELGYDTKNEKLYIGNSISLEPNLIGGEALIDVDTSTGKIIFTKFNGLSVVKDISVPIDSALSNTSMNPVQNKVIQAAITNSAEIYIGKTAPTNEAIKVWYDNTSSPDIKIKLREGTTFTEVIPLSGVYVGTGTMPNGYNIQVDPSGSVSDVVLVTKSEFDALVARVAALEG